MLKRCGNCCFKIAVTPPTHTHIHHLCLACVCVCVGGGGHPMFDCVQYLTLLWKAHRASFLRQYLWAVLYMGNKDKKKHPLVQVSIRISLSI